MVDNIVTKPLGVVLIVAAHMVLNVSSQVEVIGILGTSITLEFKFHVNLTKNSHFAVHVTGSKKIAEYIKGEEGGVFGVYPGNNSVSWCITNLKLNDSETYWASLFTEQGAVIISSEVRLIVREGNTSSSTVPPEQTTMLTTTEVSGSSSLIVTVLVVSPVVLLAALLPGLIWWLLRTKDKEEEQPPPPQHSSNPTIQETIEASTKVPAASLVYSVLDFPKRPSAVLEVNLSDTEYAAVSYLSENRRV